MDIKRIPSAGEPFQSGSLANREANRIKSRSTRHIRCNHDFVDLLHEDFAISIYALRVAFLGCPAEPKRAAISISAWASKQDEPDKALLAWARKNGRGIFRAPVESIEED